MKVYLHRDCERLKEFDADLGYYGNFNRVRSSGRGKEPSGFLPATPEMIEKVEKANTFAVLMNIKPVFPKYRDYYHHKGEWSSS